MALVSDLRNRMADLPVMAEWIDYTAQAPPIGFLHCDDLSRTCTQTCEVPLDATHFSSLRSKGCLVYDKGSDRMLSGQQYSSSFASPRRRPTIRT